MDGVLEATITLCGCKVLCSVLCLPAFKDSVSSVSLCCSCLLLFTDLTITMFLMYLWCATPRPLSFHQSSDVIALRFMLFLSNTYEAVLMLTPLLVAVELLVHRLLSRKSMTSNDINQGTKEAQESPVVSFMDVENVTSETEPQQTKNREDSGNALRALGFVGCLLLWLMSGTYAWFSWRQEQVIVKSCLEKGSVLSVCLPSILTASSPVWRQLFWTLPATGFLLALNSILSLQIAKLKPRCVEPKEYLCTVRNYDDARSIMQTQQAMLERTLNPTVSVSDNHNVDSDKSNNSCSIRSSQSVYSECPRLYEKPALSAWRIELARNCTLRLLSGTQCTVQMPQKTEFQQIQRKGPFLRGELCAGLMCGLLVCVLPTVLSTNILLVSNLDNLAVYIVKHLLTPAPSK